MSYNFNKNIPPKAGRPVPYIPPSPTKMSSNKTSLFTPSFSADSKEPVNPQLTSKHGNGYKTPEGRKRIRFQSPTQPGPQFNNDLDKTPELHRTPNGTQLPIEEYLTPPMLDFEKLNNLIYDLQGQLEYLNVLATQNQAEDAVIQSANQHFNNMYAKMESMHREILEQRSQHLTPGATEKEIERARQGLLTPFVTPSNRGAKRCLGALFSPTSQHSNDSKPIEESKLEKHPLSNNDFQTAMALKEQDDNVSSNSNKAPPPPIAIKAF